MLEFAGPKITSDDIGGRRMKIIALITFLIAASFFIKTFAASSASAAEAESAATRQTAVFETSMGTFKIELYNDLAPGTVKNFTDLIKKNYYDGIIFHRVIEDFMIQGGCPG